MSLFDKINDFEKLCNKLASLKSNAQGFNFHEKKPSASLSGPVPTYSVKTQPASPAPVPAPKPQLSAKQKAEKVVKYLANKSLTPEQQKMLDWANKELAKYKATSSLKDWGNEHNLLDKNSPT